MFVGSFDGDFDGFQSDVVQAVRALKQAKITQVILDLSNNGGVFICVVIIPGIIDYALIGGFVCLGQFLHQYLSGSKFGYPYVSPSILVIATVDSVTQADLSRQTGEMPSPRKWLQLTSRWA